MSENENKRNPINPKGTPRGYQSWIIVSLIAAILIITFLNKSTTDDISQKKFEKMVADKDVSYVTIVNDNLVEVTLTEEALKKEEYQTINKDNNYLGPRSGAHYQIQVTSAETFKNDLAEMQKDVPDSEKIEYKIATR